MSRFLTLSTALLLLAPLVAAGGETPPTAADFYAQAEARLATADFDGALALYVEAVRAEPENAAYVERARLVGRVIATRKAVEKEEATPKWERMAASLHVFYLRNGLVGEAVVLDERGHRLLAGAESASRLAEAYLESGKDAQAVELIQGLPEKARTPANRRWLAIGLARTGKLDRAVEAAEGTAPAEGAAPWDFYQAARLAAALKRTTDAAAHLTRSLSSAAPATAEEMRRHAARCVDFAVVEKDAAFTAALKTAAKAESPCSAGEGCGSCPSRDGCGK